jgi:F-type H+-transporting ATPase subunit delta
VSTELREVLRNPVLKNERAAVLAAVMSKLGLIEPAAALVRVLVDGDRIDDLEDVVEGVEALADAQAGRVRAVVKSAIPLSEAQMQRLGKALEKRVGRPVAVTVQLEPELLGGLVCQVGDLTFDSSLRRQLKQLRERLEG